MPAASVPGGPRPGEGAHAQTMRAIHVTFAPMEPRRPSKPGPVPVLAVLDVPPTSTEPAGADTRAATAPPAPPPVPSDQRTGPEGQRGPAANESSPAPALAGTAQVNQSGPAVISAVGGAEAHPQVSGGKSGAGDGPTGGPAGAVSSIVGTGSSQVAGPSPGQPTGHREGLPGSSEVLPGGPIALVGAEVVSLPLPEYPPRSRRLGEEGLVLIEVEVLPDGTAGKIRVLQSPGYPRLVAAAIEAVQKAKFKPAMSQGVPVSATVEIPVRFRLD